MGVSKLSAKKNPLNLTSSLHTDLFQSNQKTIDRI